MECVTAHTNFNSLLLHFFALEKVLSAVRLIKDIKADAVTISADLIWARRVHQLEARCFSPEGCSPSSFSLGLSAVIDFSFKTGFVVDIWLVGMRARLIWK